MAPGQKKLRDSCDSCHTAKVKCMKAKSGECLRCISSGLPCSFSPSDRRGKPRGAKNKCNRVPPPSIIRPNTIARTPSSTSDGSSLMPGLTPDGAYPSPACEFEKYFGSNSRDEFAASEPNWSFHAQGDSDQCVTVSGREEGLGPTAQADWMNMEDDLMHSGSPLQQPTPSLSSRSTLPESSLTSPPPPPALPTFSAHPHTSQGMVLQRDLSSFEPGTEACECQQPLGLRTICAFYDQETASCPGSSTSFDMALLINNKAIERCHIMLSCGQCILSSDKGRVSTNMLTIAGAIDEILISYGSACIAPLDAGVQDTLVLSSDGTIGVSTNQDEMADFGGTTEFVASTQGPNQESSAAASGKSNKPSARPAFFMPAAQLSLGSYRIEGEDGYHLKLEILKIELRKTERLWLAFRDTLAQQQLDDESRNLYGALVCYLAKKLRQTAELLEARRRTPTAGGW